MYDYDDYTFNEFWDIRSIFKEVQEKGSIGGSVALDSKLTSEQLKFFQGELHSGKYLEKAKAEIKGMYNELV
jgi:hypothetical protein